MGMFSRAVDAVWHDLLQDSKQYEKFSRDACGVLVEHVEGEGEGHVLWVDEYEARFGKLDPIWFSDELGRLDQRAYDDYYETGKVLASWDCSPIACSHRLTNG